MTNQQLALLTTAGGILAVAGSLLPWATISTGLGSISIAGTQGDGTITLILGVVVGLLGFARYGSPNAGLAATSTVVGIAIAAAGAYDYVNLSERLGASTGSVAASVGVGLYLVILGGVLALFGGMKGRADEAPPTE